MSESHNLSTLEIQIGMFYQSELLDSNKLLSSPQFATYQPLCTSLALPGLLPCVTSSHMHDIPLLEYSRLLTAVLSTQQPHRRDRYTQRSFHNHLRALSLTIKWP